MDLERLDELFQQLNELTGVRDIAYHEIKDGRLSPVLKTNTDVLGVEKWRSVHAQSPVYVEHDKLLSEMMREPRALAVQDVKNDPRSADEFFLFGIDSILILPVLNNRVVRGIVAVASIGGLHEFTEEEIRKAELLLERYRSVFQT
ncbi:GAF domain-containing protein [Paenibacillus oenotherae]|uniref:GAF domain-containing protein n=1 Tax=Paenibacillus oenotherae TaxID=1435645 RepID=A0ABS7D476_9BACL|nr:GAF domain-containing protein [Paenibacillus oenotherae]MBW7474737.1 GAF domain-containing protein [Paenibacillus oenotherae]